MELAMIDSKVMGLDELGPEYLDRGTFFGDGVYEVVRSYSGKLFALDEHLARFDRSLREIGIDNVDIEEIRDRINTAFEKAQIPDCKIYFHITRGSDIRNHLWEEELKPNFFLTLQTLELDMSYKQTGVKVSTYPDIRWKRCDIKSLNLLGNVMAKADAKKKGCWEAVFVDDNGIVTEGAGSAFFAIIDGALVTHKLGPEILPSITRSFIVKIAEQIGVRLDERSITAEQAAEADELFLAVTTRDIVPIVEFDGKPISGGKPGPISAKLSEAFMEEVRRQLDI